MNQFYKRERCLSAIAYDPAGFSWIDLHDTDNSVVSFMRRSNNADDTLLFVSNFTPVPRHGYRLGVPDPGEYYELINSDATRYGGSGLENGQPMPSGPILWQRLLRFDPENPIWMNRDRFVLSAGHASMLLYSILHLTGVKAVNAKYERLGELSVKLDDIQHFRQLNSKCPGHPEYRWTSGVEVTTGPLGQGVATSGGMAIAGRWLSAHFNRPGFQMFHYDGS